MYENKEEIEKVILFAVDLDNGEQVPANLDELEELVATAGAETLGRMIQNKDSIEKATYLGLVKSRICETWWSVLVRRVSCAMMNYRRSR